MTDTPKPAAKPTRLAPIVTLDAKYFWDGADREEFLGQRCGECGKLRFPPRPMCPHCHSVKTETVKLSGRGRVCSWIVPRHPLPFGFTEAQIVATVDLDEGFRLVTNLYEVRHEDVTIGMPVEVFFAPTQQNHKVPVFRPAKGAKA